MGPAGTLPHTWLGVRVGWSTTASHALYGGSRKHLQRGAAHTTIVRLAIEPRTVVVSAHYGPILYAYTCVMCLPECAARVRVMRRVDGRGGQDVRRGEGNAHTRRADFLPINQIATVSRLASRVMLYSCDVILEKVASLVAA